MFYYLLFPEFKVPNKSLSHELNNVFILMVVVVVQRMDATILTKLNETNCSLLLKHEILKKLVTFISPKKRFRQILILSGQ